MNLWSPAVSESHSFPTKSGESVLQDERELEKEALSSGSQAEPGSPRGQLPREQRDPGGSASEAQIVTWSGEESPGAWGESRPGLERGQWAALQKRWVPGDRELYYGVGPSTPGGVCLAVQTCINLAVPSHFLRAQDQFFCLFEKGFTMQFSLASNLQ